MTRPVEREREPEAKAPAVVAIAPPAGARAGVGAARAAALGGQSGSRARAAAARAEGPAGRRDAARRSASRGRQRRRSRRGADRRPTRACGGGWSDKNGKSESGHVGGVDRILLEGHAGQPAAAVRSGRRARARRGRRGHGRHRRRDPQGRAIAIVPNSLKGGPGGEVAVLVHFHGIGKALRERGDNPRDVDHYQIEQQLDAFVAANPGTRIVALLPIGVQTGNNARDKHGVSLRQFRHRRVRHRRVRRARRRAAVRGKAGRRDPLRPQRRRSAAGRDAGLGQGRFRAG